MRRLLALFGIGTKKKSVFLRDRFPQYNIGRGSYGHLRVRSWGEGATLSIGAFCSFAGGVRIFLGGEHRVDWVSTYPFSEFWPQATQGLTLPPSHSRGNVVIGHDVWIGTDALILSGVRIGNGAVIGARSVVTKDVPPYAIVAGNPARVVRLRFPEEIVKRLEKLAWWDWDDRKIERYVPLLLSGDVARFLDEAEQA